MAKEERLTLFNFHCNRPKKGSMISKGSEVITGKKSFKSLIMDDK